jgi:putative tricarboxylic transport membrane protein
VKPSCFAALRGTLIGFIIGVIPGAGPTVSTFISYATEKRLSKTPDRFGKGAIEGIAGPQSSSHSATIAGMIPLLCLGIPASGTAAVLLGGFLVHGLQPGPLLFTEHPEVVWGMIASLYLANLILLLLNTISIPFFIWLLKVSQKYIYPVIGVLTLIGAYSLNNNIFDVWLALAFGLLGFFFRTLEIPLAPLVIALVLGRKAEITCRQSLVMFDGNALRLFERPISLFLITCALAILVFPLISSLYKKIREKKPLSKSF